MKLNVTKHYGGEYISENSKYSPACEGCKRKNFVTSRCIKHNQVNIQQFLWLCDKFKPL